MSSSVRRKAWNDAMKSASGQQGRSVSRRTSDRTKKQARREKARKSTLSDGLFDNTITTGGGFGAVNYVAAARIDVLEGVSQENTELEDEDFLDDDSSSGATKNGRGRKQKKTPTRKRKTADKNDPSKRFKARSLASILMEEANRPDGVADKYLKAEARPILSKDSNKFSSGSKIKLCPVTGLIGNYTDPKTGIPYANLKAYEQIKERAPPWMTRGGAVSYFEALRSLRADENK